jgi:hypothetical protein
MTTLSKSKIDCFYFAALPAISGGGQSVRGRCAKLVKAKRRHRRIAGMGHNVASIDGAAVGGFQSILVMLNTPAITSSSAQPSHGFYRAGSDPRKDGQAVGW